MSFVQHTEDYFHFKQDQPVFKRSQTIQQHDWIYDCDDLGEIMACFQEEDFAIAKLAEMGGVQGIAFALRTNTATGIGEDEINNDEALAVRQKLFGVNALTHKPPTPFWELVLDQLEDLMIRILIVCGIVSIIIGAVQDPQHHGWTEGLAVLLAVILVAMVGSLNNYSKEKQFRAMEMESQKKDTIVLRAGKEYKVPFEEVIVGDLVVLRAGFTVPCDGIFVFGTENLKADESGLTGESREISKNRFHPLVLKGTHITSGDGLMIATLVGDKTEWGKLLAKLHTSPEDTPLQEKLKELGKLIGFFGMGVAIVLFIILMVVWGVNGANTPPAATAVIRYLIMSITLVVVAVPEGLPLAVTLALAYSMKKMLNDNNFVRLLEACETMGNATTICSDKTGTLTQNKMSVTRVLLNNKDYQTSPKQQNLSPNVYKLLTECLICNSKAFEEEPKTEKERALIAQNKLKPTLVGGNQTECAMLQFAIDLGAKDYKQIREDNPVTKFFPFDSAIKRSSVLVKNQQQENRYYMYTKGAAEQIVDLCSYWLDEKGNVQKLEKEYLDKINKIMSDMTHNALRCLGACYREYNKSEIQFDRDGKTLSDKHSEPLFNDMVLLCICGIQDPVRPEVPDAVLTCQKAGIIVRMVTGDHLETAKNIARQCHILTSKDHICIEGKTFRNLSQTDKARVLPNLRVLARSRPSDKEELVSWYKDVNKDIVAVTGDGANDALALKKASVGLAMGIQGTDIAKEASHIVIMDDNFASIEKTVMWGRNVYDSIRKFVQFQTTINIVALTISLIGAFIPEYQNPLKAVQLLWVNLIMDTMAALALATEPPSLKLLNRLPYARDAQLISPTMWRFIIGHAAWQLAILLMTMFKASDWLHIPSDEDLNQFNQSEQLLTIIFNVFVFLQVFNEINARRVNNEWNVFENFFANPYFIGVLAVTVVFQVIIVEFGGDWTSTHGLTGKQWGYCIGLGATSLVWNQIIRVIPINLRYGMIEVDPKEFKEDIEIVSDTK